MSPSLRFLQGFLTVVLIGGAQTPPYIEQGPRLPGVGGQSVALSSDGNTAIIGNSQDSGGAGSATVWTRTNGVWTQQMKLIGSGATGAANQGAAVAISFDGNTAVVGGPADNASAGAIWIFSRALGVWSQMGSKLVGTGAVGAAAQGTSVAISGDGATVFEGGPHDSNGAGATWAFSRSSSTWSQQGARIVGAGAVGAAAQGTAVALSNDGNTAIVSGPSDNATLVSTVGAIWFFTRTSSTWTQSGNKLGGPALNTAFGAAVAMSGDSNTAIVGAPTSGQSGGALVYTQSNSAWTQQATLSGSGFLGDGAKQGTSVSLSFDGSLSVVGGTFDGHTTLANAVGAVWVFGRAGNAWTQLGSKLVGADYQGFPLQGSSVAISGDGTTILEGGPGDTGGGSAWFFISTPLSGCNYSISAGALTVLSISAGALTVPSTASSQTVSVITGANCFWQASSTASFISITPPDSASGNGSVSFSIAANTTGTQRNGTLIIAGQPLTVTQLGTMPVPVFNTGVVFAGIGFPVGGVVPSLAPDGSVDTHYSLFASADPAFPGPNAMVTNSNNLPAACLPNGPSSKWIAPRADVSTGNAAGSYTYRTTFDLTGLSAANASLSGHWATDGTGIMKLNGVPVGSSSASNSLYTPFLVSSGFVSGSNTLDFVVSNASAGHATGVRVELSGSTTPATAADQLPAPTGVTPASGSTAAGSFVFTFTDPRGWQDLNVVDILVNNVLDGRSACYIAFVPSTGAVYLVDDAGDSGGPYTGFTLPGSGTATNSQCTLTGSGSSFNGTGNNLTLTLAISFKTAFNGNRVIYAAARDNEGNNSGWQAVGTWNVPGGTAPTGPSVVSTSPASGGGSNKTFTFTFTDTKGASDISVVNVLINRAIDGRVACYVAFVPSGPAAGTLYLVEDDGDAGGPFAGGMLLPGTNTVQNSQCSISGAGSSVATNGNNLTLTLAITFSQGFRGNQIVFTAARSATQNSGWQAMGTWTVQ